MSLIFLNSIFRFLLKHYSPCGNSLSYQSQVFVQPEGGEGKVRPQRKICYSLNFRVNYCFTFVYKGVIVRAILISFSLCGLLVAKQQLCFVSCIECNSGVGRPKYRSIGPLRCILLLLPGKQVQTHTQHVIQVKASVNRMLKYHFHDNCSAEN